MSARAFDVVCIGEALFHLSTNLELRGGGGAVNVAVALARKGRRVGLVTTLADDTPGRKLRDRIAAAGVDVDGVTLSPPRSSLFIVNGVDVFAHRDGDRPVEVPEGWQAQVVLLSGLTPVVSHAASLCKAARAARRDGSVVVIDVHAR